MVPVLAALVIGCRPHPQPSVLLATIRQIEIPESDSIDGQTVLGGAERRDELARQRSSLVQELYAVAPDDPHVPRLLVESWESTPKVMDGIVRAREVKTRERNRAIREAAAYFLAERGLQFPKLVGRTDMMDPLEFAREQFLDTYPKSEFAPDLLWTAHQAYHRQTAESLAKQAEIRHELFTEFPKWDRYYAVRDAVDGQQANPAVGSVLHLSFNDAIHGLPIDTAGKVVVLDGWATYCASCVAHMPALQALQSRYANRGLQVVGVSLDDHLTGGLTTARAFLAQHGYDWPQFYEGGYRAFCSRWKLVGGVVYVFDRSGRLVAANPPMDKLEGIVRKYLSAPS